MIKLILSRLNIGRFGRDEKGSASIEAMIMIPMVFWVYLAMFAFFQTYQEYNANQKAAYTIGDMISRETLPLDVNYLNGVQQLLDYMTRSSETASVRVTSLQYNLAEDRFYVHWSRSRGLRPPVTDADVSTWTSRIPIMPDGEFIVITETWTKYDPPFNVGLGAQDIENFVYTRPRYAPRVLYSGAT